MTEPRAANVVRRYLAASYFAGGASELDTSQMLDALAESAVAAMRTLGPFWEPTAENTPFLIDFEENGRG